MVVYGILDKLSNGEIRDNLNRVTSLQISLLDVVMDITGTAQKRSAEHFRGVTISSRFAFLLCLFIQGSDRFTFPSESLAVILLHILELFERAFARCNHWTGELVRLHPSLLGRLCRSTPTAILTLGCVTLCVYMAVTLQPSLTQVVSLEMSGMAAFP